MSDGAVQFPKQKIKIGRGGVLPTGLAAPSAPPRPFKIHRMKRFTEAFKWSDPWFRKLTPPQKLFWLYICDNCDNAGVWKIDLEMAGFQIGSEIKNDIINEINKGKERIKIFDGNQSLLIKDYINFQIGNIYSNSLTNLQKSALALIEKYIDSKGLLEVDFNLTGKLPVVYGYKYKGKGKGKGNKKEDKKESKEREERGKIYAEIIDDLNSILKTSYQSTTPKIRELIEARLKDNHTVEDFKTVHRKMFKAWGTDNKMRQYLRPHTLYTSKFEAYLNRPDDLPASAAGAKTYANAKEWLRQRDSGRK